MATLSLLVMLEVFLSTDGTDGLRCNYFKTQDLLTTLLRSTNTSTFILHCGLMCLSLRHCKEFSIDKIMKTCCFDQDKCEINPPGGEHWEVQLPTSNNKGKGVDASSNAGHSLLLAPTFSYNPVLKAIENCAFHGLQLNVTDRISTLTYAFTTETLFIAKSVPSSIVSYVKSAKYGTVLGKKVIRQFANDEGSNMIAYVEAHQPNAIGAMDTNGKNHRKLYRASDNLYTIALDPRNRLMFVHMEDKTVKMTYKGKIIGKIKVLNKKKKVKLCFNTQLNTLFFNVGMNIHTLKNGTTRKLVTLKFPKDKVCSILCYQEKIFLTFKRKDVILVVENGKARNFATVQDSRLLYAMTSYRSVVGPEHTLGKCNSTDVIVEKTP